MTDSSRLQPPIPKRFRVPTLVQPQWRWEDLLKTGGGKYVLSDLSEEIKRQYGVKHCLLVDRARTGLYLLSRGMKLRGEWLTTSFMHRPTAVLLRNNVSSLVLADIHDDFTMDLESAVGLISGSTEAILVTHMYGKSADIRSFRRLADQRGLFLIENAVHMPGGVTVDGRRIASWGDAALLSFNVDKPLGGILGGALLTNRDDVWQAVASHALALPNRWETWGRILSTYAAYRLKPLMMRLPALCRYTELKDGVKDVEAFSVDAYRHYTPRTIHALQASVALMAMHRSAGYRNARSTNAELLIDRLRGINDIVLPSSTPDQPHSYLYFPVIFNRVDRFEVGKRYAEFGIETKWRYFPLHMQTDFSECRHDSLATTARCWRRHLLLPIGPSLTDKDVNYIAQCTAAIMQAE
jgi:dTDP-4-amino-4,6-dideoxygalactose transaminase